MPEVDKAITAWRQAPDATALTAAGKPFQQAVAEHRPMIPLVVRNNIWEQRKNVHGGIPHQYDIYPHYNDVWIT